MKSISFSIFDVSIIHSRIIEVSFFEHVRSDQMKSLPGWGNQRTTSHSSVSFSLSPMGIALMRRQRTIEAIIAIARG